MDYALKKAERTADAMLLGHAEVSPCRREGSLSCEHCDYGSLCGYDSRNPAFRSRNIESLKQDEFMERCHEVDE